MTPTLLVLLLVSVLIAYASPGGPITSLVTFGDSFSDVVSIWDGGEPWPVYAAEYANVTLYPFASAGGTCSNAITPKPFPSIMESQIPAYLNTTRMVNLTADTTLYTEWIGTNDIGVGSLLTGSNSASIVDVAGCIVDWVKVLHKTGAKNFLVQNMIPLQDTVLYSPTSYPNRYFVAPRNTTEWSITITELVLAGNKLVELMLKDLVRTLPDAHIGLFDSHSLFSHMYAKPADYLNGTAPLNVTGAARSCVYELNGTKSTMVCTRAEGTDRDSFLWWDELHPSEQANRIVAREIEKVVNGTGSKWAKWFS